MKLKTLIFCFSAFLLSIEMNAQDYSNLQGIILKEKTDYPKNETLVLECSNYLLNSPVGTLDSDLNRLRAIQFIMRWMEGTPDFMFTIDESITKVTKSNTSLLTIYLASMCKYVLENKEKAADQNEVKYNSFLTFINYCEDPSKNVKLNKGLKELIKVKNENILKEYLKM